MSPLLIGTRVVLEPLSVDHIADLVAAATEDRSSYAFTLVPADKRAMRSYVEEAIALRDKGQAVPFAVRFDGRIVGSTRFWDLDEWYGGPTPSAFEIGWTWYSASAQRTPCNTEAKLLLLTQAFDTWHVRRVTLKTDARNERSRAAIARIGGRFEGIRRRHHLASDGTIRDSAYFSILDDEWPDVRVALTARLS